MPKNDFKYVFTSFDKRMLNLSIYSTEIRQKVLQNPLIGPTESLELEVRFQKVRHSDFNRVLELVSKKYPLTSSKITDYLLPEEVRISVVGKPPGFERMKIFKKDLWHDIMPNFNIKVSLAKETISEREDINYEYKMNPRPTKTRIKDRKSFIISEGVVRLDMTVATTLDQSGQIINTSYEIECEIISLVSDNNIKILAMSSTEILKMIQDTNNIYSISDKNEIIDDFNKTLGTPNFSNKELGKVFSHRILAQARNLKRADCIYGGLVGGKVKYTITHKLKGYRKLLYFHEKGICLIFPPLSLNLLILPQHYKLFGFEAPINAIRGTIIDGESYDTDYYPFDMMSNRGNIQVQKSSHTERMKSGNIIDTLATYNFQQLIKIKKKEFIPIPDLSELRKALIRLEGEQKSLPYETDGYIITPDDSPYTLPGLQKPINGCYIVYDLPLHKRNLKKWPEICKLKPWKELTIDLLFTKQNLLARESRECGAKGSQQNIIFAGSIFHSFSYNILPSTLDKVPDGSIVELGPSGTLEEFEALEDKVPKLEVRLIRYDKTAPNTENNAASVWDDINEPLTIKTLLGQNFNLMFQYHSSEKSKLLDNLPSEANILDIGSGRGGTLGKMSKFNHIVCVEPDKDNLKELNRRSLISFHGHKMADKITIVETGGEDSKEIINKTYTALKWNSDGINRPFYITMFLSLSFFFRDDILLGQLATTIKEVSQMYYSLGGKYPVQLIFTTIEKNQLLNVARTAHPSLTNERVDLGQFPTVKFKVGEAKMIITAPNRVWIDIPNSIVRDQNEFFVDLPKLQRFCGLTELKTEIHNKEKFLSDNERTFSSMYVSGTATIPIPLKVSVPYNRTFGMSGDGLIVEMLTNDGRFFSAVGVPFAKNGEEIRSYYASWLMSVDPRYPTEMDAINALYGGIDPKYGIYKDNVGANINYYTVIGGNYSRYLNNVPGDLKGFDYIMKYIQDPNFAIPHIIVEALGYALNVTINIASVDNRSNIIIKSKTVVPGTPEITIIDGGSDQGIYNKYSVMAIWRNEQLEYVF